MDDERTTPTRRFYVVVLALVLFAVVDGFVFGVYAALSVQSGPAPTDTQADRDVYIALVSVAAPNQALPHFISYIQEKSRRPKRVVSVYTPLGINNLWGGAPTLDDEQRWPLERHAAAGDFGTGISAVLSWDESLFINPDLTLYVDRQPRSDWICLEARTTLAPGGIGTAESVLWDEQGRLGRASQALLVARHG